MSWKASIFHIQNAIKTTFMNGITWNLVHMFLVAVIVDKIRFFENLELVDFFAKGKRWKEIKIFKTLKIFKTKRPPPPTAGRGNVEKKSKFSKLWRFSKINAPPPLQQGAV